MSWFAAGSVCYGAATPAGWTLSPLITLPLLAVALVYGLGSWRLWRRSNRGRGRLLRQSWTFAAGWVMLALALVTPLHALGERLFTAHMLEHELMMAVAAPLLAASAPGAALLWAVPRGWRAGLGQAVRNTAVASVWTMISLPIAATLLHGAAIWLWHLPVLFDAALQRGVLHYLQHASFLGTALLFWWVMLPRGNPARAGEAVLHLFFTTLHTGLLGVLLALSPRLWYPANASAAFDWSLTPLEDQQLAGLVMWVPAGLVYGGAALVLAGLWIRSSGRAGHAYADRGLGDAP